MVVYSAIFLVVGVPAFVLGSKRKSHKFKWGPDDLFGDDGPLRPPPSPGRKMMGQPSPQSLDDTSVSCDGWAESAALPGEPSTTGAGMAAIRLGFPLVEQIALRLNTSSGQPEDYVFGSLTVDMNPEKNTSSTVLMGSAKYSNVSLLRATSVCLTRSGNTTEITIHVRSTSFVDGVAEGSSFVVRRLLDTREACQFLRCDRNGPAPPLTTDTNTDPF